MNTQLALKTADILIAGGSIFHHPKNNMFDASVENTLPLSVEEIESGPWDGVGVDGRKSASRGFIMASFNESESSPGFFHCRVTGGTSSETRRPVIAGAVGIMLDHMLSEHRWGCSELKWKRSDVVCPVAAHAPAKLATGEIVYFLRAGEFIKIGKATGSPTKRLSQLKTGCPFPIEVVATMPGGYALERELHQRFATLRAHGEWFHAAPELVSFIATAEGVA